MATNETTKAARDGNGRWVPGQSGNPAGKPPGTRNYATILRERLAAEDVETATKTLSDKLAAGHWGATRFVLERIDPKPRGRPIAFAVDDNTDVGALLDAALRAVAGGEISIEEGTALLRFVQERREMREVAAPAPVARVEPAPVARPEPASAPSIPAPSPESDLNLQARDWTRTAARDAVAAFLDRSDAPPRSRAA